MHVFAIRRRFDCDSINAVTVVDVKSDKSADSGCSQHKQVYQPLNLLDKRSMQLVLIGSARNGSQARTKYTLVFAKRLRYAGAPRRSKRLRPVVEAVG